MTAPPLILSKETGSVLSANPLPSHRLKRVVQSSALTFTYRKPNDPQNIASKRKRLPLPSQAFRLHKTPIQAAQRRRTKKHTRHQTAALRASYLHGSSAVSGCAALAVVGGIIWAIWFCIRKRRKNAPTAVAIKNVPQRPAYEIAMKLWIASARERLWQNGAVKEYHTRLTDILRVCVEDTFTLPHWKPRRTRFFTELRTTSCPPGTVEMLRAVLEKSRYGQIRTLRAACRRERTQYQACNGTCPNHRT